MKIDNMDDSEANAKVSDSAYSNSCSASQSRRSHSSKWTNSGTHSGSNSSGSSGYGGKPSDFSKSESPGQSSEKRSKDKDSKKKKSIQMDVQPPQTQTDSENGTMEPVTTGTSSEDKTTVGSSSPLTQVQSSGVESLELATTEKNNSTDESVPKSLPIPNDSGTIKLSSNNNKFNDDDGFSCVISMHDGVVIYTTSSLTLSLGFPKQMWIGRSFIDFVHPSDRLTFAAQITNGLAVPKNVNGTQQKASLVTSVSTMVCRIRRYTGLASGYSVKERKVCYTPFLLNLSFKNITDEEGNVIYLVIQATKFVSAFKVPNEPMVNAVPFVIRHDANGNLEYIDTESVPYLGYLPQDIFEKDALQFYHPEDLEYLCQVYETIVRKGSLKRSKPFRMLAQNGDYLKVETEWSSFINPWSRKLEFVIGKHHLIEGPQNPDVFQLSVPDKNLKQTTEEKTKAQNLRDQIVRIMNEVLPKPAEMVKNQKMKRCQDLVTFMENLIENQPKAEVELRVDVNDADQSCYERDSVMLGGISPHHDHNDSKSGTETLWSYNQLNYNENLQRYFDCHQPYSNKDYNMAVSENVIETKEIKTGACPSPIAQLSGDSIEISSVGESSGITVENSSVTPAEDTPLRLTELLLGKHNTEMEKELVKLHKEIRSVSKADREKASNENKIKKKEHLARCFNSFLPVANDKENRTRGLKRASKPNGVDSATHKHHCPSSRPNRRRLPTSADPVLPSSTSAAPVLPSSTITTTVAETQWPAAPVNSINTFLLGVPQQVSMFNPISAVPGVFPFYYGPSGNPMNPMIQTPTTMTAPQYMYDTSQFNLPSVQCMLYGQAIYGSPFMYSPVTQITEQDNLMAQTLQFSNTFVSPADTNNKPGMSKVNSLWRDKKRSKSSKRIEENADSSNSSNNTMNQGSGEDQNGNTTMKSEHPATSTAMETNTISTNSKTKNHSEDRTDGESTYSSFNSSFFKTDSGSAEESEKKQQLPNVKAPNKTDFLDSQKYKVCVSSELVFKYQVVTKSLDEVLLADKENLNKLEQPTLVNEQLSQLYMDLQLEGVVSKLTLDEGFTSSSNSSEAASCNTEKIQRRKRGYSKLALIYEEETPLPPPSSDEDNLTEPATTEC